MGVTARKGSSGYLQRLLNRCEKRVILSAFRRNGENQRATATELGINRNTLRSRLMEYGVLEPDNVWDTTSNVNFSKGKR